MDTQLINRRALKARALLLGDRLDLKQFKIADCLATTPLTLQVDAEGGIAVLFRYGVVVFFGVKSLDEVRFVESLKPLLTNSYLVPETEELEIHCGRSSMGVQSGAVSLDESTLEKLQVIADALSKNLVLSLYEKKVAGEFDKIEPLAQELATHGKVSADSKKLLSKIGFMLLIEHRMVGRAEIGVATLYLGVIGSVLGFMLYYYMIKHMEAGQIALITLIAPVIALLLGHGLNNEAVLPHVWLGTASIVLGLCMHRWGGQWLAYLLSRRAER